MLQITFVSFNNILINPQLGAVMTRNCGGVVSPAPYTTQSLDTGMCPGLDIIYRYLDIIYRYLDIICRYLDFVYRYLDIVTMNGSSDDCGQLRWSGCHYLVVIRAVHEPSRSFTVP